VKSFRLALGVGCKKRGFAGLNGLIRELEGIFDSCKVGFMLSGKPSAPAGQAAPKMAGKE
jgi:hypothetical protein